MKTWTKLTELAQAAKSESIVARFDDPDRAQNFSARFGSMLFDYSKTSLDSTSMEALIALAEERGVAAKRTAMFSGEKINEMEDRAVLHTALRRSDTGVFVDGEDVMPGVHATLDRMVAFAEDVRSGAFAGQGGSITDVVNIGIGGSDLGPVMAVQALASYIDGPRCHFVSNVDGAHIAQVMRGLDLTRTLVIVASKTFTTIETMTNAQTAKDMMAEVCLLYTSDAADE